MTVRRLLLTTLLLVIQCFAYREQKFAMEPQNQTAIIGSRVTLPCRIINKSGVLQWTKDDFGLGTHRDLNGFDRYRMIGSDEEGDYSLEIHPVMLEDDARYQCQVSVGKDGEQGIRSQFATLTVLVPPEPPKIVQGDFSVTTEDREIELECISVAGKPAAEITWIDGHGNVLTDKIDYIIEPLSDGRRYTAKSVLKLLPRKKHHNTTFTCQAQNAADRTYKSAKLRLEVLYAPKVSVKITSGLGISGRIAEGADIRLTCFADANPRNPLTYTWILNNDILPENGTELILRNVTRDMHDAMVKCRAKNTVGESEAFETLEVSYAPQFRHKLASVQVEVGSTATLVCDVAGNPPPDIIWIHENTQKVMGTTPNLTLTVDKGMGGRYICKASITGYPTVWEAGSIYIKGRPNINSAAQQFGELGETAAVECTAHAIPRPDHVVWMFNGAVIDASDPDYIVEESPLPDGIRSKLFIRDSQIRHYGVYNCSVTNPYGIHWREIHFRPKKNFPHLLILTGVISGVIIIVSIILVVILCQRKRIKKPIPMDFNGEKTCKESDRSSNISDLKLDLRTGSSVSNMHCELDYGLESETGSESVVTKIGVPLAGPVPLQSLSTMSTLTHTGHIPPQTANGSIPSNDRLYRYSAEFGDPVFPPKEGHNNNGYVPYVDYTRDYTPPSVEASHTSGTLRLSCVPATGGVDPRYSAVYGNPYLRSSTSSLPAPPPYTATRQSSSPSGSGSGSGSIVCGPQPPPLSNGAVPQVARLPTSPTSQYIVPSREQVTVKRGTLATHV